MLTLVPALVPASGGFEDCHNRLWMAIAHGHVSSGNVSP